MYQFRAEQFLPIPIEQAWAFFSAAQNLSKITPPEMKFNVLTQLKDEEIYNGMLIDYTVRPLFGIPLHWQTEICKVERPTMFTDQQLKGPFKTWHHTHTFKSVAGGTLMCDVVDYELPLGIIGKLAHAILVKQRVENIFIFRKKILDQFFK